MRIGEVFVQREILTDVTVKRMLAVSRSANKRLGTVLEEIGLITDEELACAVAFQYGYDIVKHISEENIPSAILDLIPFEIAFKHVMIPLKLSRNNLLVAVNDPTNIEVLRAITSENGFSYTLFVAPHREIIKAIARYYRREEASEVAKPALLIVDDDQFIRSMLTSAFGDEYRVICAGNGLEGIKKAVEFKPNVILTDMQMPEADGYELLEQLQQNAETRSIPVVLMTGRNEPDEEVMALDKGFFDFVTKPFGMPRLYARIKKAMRYSGWNVANKKL